MWTISEKPKFGHFSKKTEGQKNYRSISIFSYISKVNERCLYEQTYSYFDKIFNIM